MPQGTARARLQADIQAISHDTIPNIQGIQNGDVQDEFVFFFVHSAAPRGKIEIRVLPQAVAGYPRDNSFLVYTNDDVPNRIGTILDNTMTSTIGMCVEDLLGEISRQLRNSFESTDEASANEAVCGSLDDDADMDAYLSDVSNDTDTSSVFEYGDEDDYTFVSEPLRPLPVKTPDSTMQRIRKDFMAVRNAGFRVSKIYGIDQVCENSIMAISIKVSKLGLSSETHTAWNLEASDYLVLLIKYPRQYMTLEEALETPAGQTSLEFRLRKCSKYRPTREGAMIAFSITRPALDPERKSITAAGELLTFGVGGSLELLLNKEFLSLMKLRKMKNVSWDDAKRIQSHLAITGWDKGLIEIPPLDPSTTNIADTTLPPILMGDHLLQENAGSLPLVAMQFTLRYFVKCTDYCMICHEKIAGNLEALKPYVCDKPLCLFQYMNLGLGPSIDHEIINQVNVVDLLISFCYASLHCPSGRQPKLREFPLGLSLQVPCIQRSSPRRHTGDIAINGCGTLLDPIGVELSWSDAVARITDQSPVNRQDLRVGQWVVIHTQHNNMSETPDLSMLHHARIEEFNGSILQLHIASRHPVPMETATYEKVRFWNWEGHSTGHLVLCNRPLDDIDSNEEKAFSLSLLLSILPSVGEMRTYLVANRIRQLATWNRIPPDAMKFLRWIIASNRSFIVQLDGENNKEMNAGDTKTNGPSQSQKKILGVNGWIQFGFAQGSPEKEALFLDALQAVENPVRTIMAWHGSSVGNWHSIIREGLNYDVVVNGRSYGNGVYFSRSFDHSLGFTASENSKCVVWPQSSLKISRVMSLNELVNLPDKFKHSVRCYVVDILHWIQCRYLFVCPAIAQIEPHENVASEEEEFVQDPKYTASGPFNKKLFIPKLAIPSIQRQQRRGPPSQASDRIDGDDTDDEDVEDAEFLAIGDSAQNDAAGPEPTPTHQISQTDFCPGQLDFSKLPQLALPSYATKPAQYTIQRELQKLEKVQSTTPLHELGWYLDFDKIDNMFQWIVELHSFDPSLPLAKDMKTAGITSIVLEIRFLRGFPVTPPFVRVIKPRFLPFVQGGGGHVTSGGAMCMELLTNTGWSPVSSMESVLLQVRLAMCSLEPKPARLATQKYGADHYSVQEAVDAYTRAAAQHGWEVPVELKEAAVQ